MWIGHGKEFPKLTFWVLALRLSESDEELTLETSAFEFQSLRWPMCNINPVDKTKLSYNTLHRRSTTVSLETYPLYSSVG